MTISKKNFWAAAVFGLIIGTTFTFAAAFTEPTTSPANTTSYPPINIGPETQFINNPVAFGDGTNKADSGVLSSNSLFVKENLNSDASNIRQNANFVQNTTVNGRNIVGGLIRVAQVSVLPDSSQNYTSTSEKLFFPKGTTTNLITGNYCTTAANTSCPLGTVLYSYDSSSQKAKCRYINPKKTGGNLGSCPTNSSNVSVTLSSTNNNQNSCTATKNYTASGSSSGYLWYLKGVNETDWTYLGTGSTKSVSVYMSGSSEKVYDLIVRDSAYPASNTTTEVYSVVDSSCQSQQQSTSGTTGSN